uniref:sterile alpha motif domain-containing protein 9-like isoform X2 n=1 Tax=Gasterosteus aculeatus aculeatus TaxID=481459 RepID=UPI001A98E05B|nr:sterile alpha motif domain-containing protein 9-like isoform X2 [Gasterosteus aculeatus aculeatus]
MASEPSRPGAQSGTFETQQSLSLLDVLCANQFEGKSFPPELLRETEESFYRGAPPKWLNFHISEQGGSGGARTPFIARDGYAALVEKIRHARSKLQGTSTVKLLHQPGCGGTTLAMKVLWDLRRAFRCAVLTGSTSDAAKVAEEVVALFTAGSRRGNNTVLLLVNDETLLENLKDGVRARIAQGPISTYVPVLILLNCVRKDDVRQGDHVVLQKALSAEEKLKFDAKKRELYEMYGERCHRFHGFNILQTNFSPAYVEAACSVFKPTKRADRPRKTQLAAFLSLLNAYVPGSFLPEWQCRDFFQRDADRRRGDFSLEDRMEPFSHLLVVFQRDERADGKVRMAHPLIARRCTELMAESGVTRSDTAINLLTRLCKDQSPPHVVVGFVKGMLTKRGLKPRRRNKTPGPANAADTQEDEERYARLILDIQRMESRRQSASVLKAASNLFDGDPFLPQALARFYYTELKDYNLAELWAERAKLRDPRNSFVADTLGQVHKNRLKNTAGSLGPLAVLQLASRAIEAFKDEEKLAENERGEDMRGDGDTRVSQHFNIRGQFGYLQLCNDVFHLLVEQEDTWREVLTKKVALDAALESLGDERLIRFKGLIDSLRGEIERKCAFFNKYLTYSKPKLKDDPDYISAGSSECYENFVGSYPPEDLKRTGAVLIQRLKKKKVYTSAAVLSCLESECRESDLKEITTWWEEIFRQKESINYIVSLVVRTNADAAFPSDRKRLSELKQKMPEILNDSPELHMLTLLLCWPADGEARCALDLGQLVRRMKRSFEVAYEMHLRSRRLRPLFFVGNGKGLDRMVHRKVLENLLLEQSQETKQDPWSGERMFHDPEVQARLVKVEGVVREYRLFATIGGAVVELEANNQDSLWKPRRVSFYLGFTIRGPVAFAVQTDKKGNAHEPEMLKENSRMKKTDVTGESESVLRHVTGPGGKDALR